MKDDPYSSNKLYCPVMSTDYSYERIKKTKFIWRDYYVHFRQQGSSSSRKKRNGFT